MTSGRSARPTMSTPIPARVPIPRERPDQQAAGPDPLDIATMIEHAQHRFRRASSSEEPGRT